MEILAVSLSTYKNKWTKFKIQVYGYDTTEIRRPKDAHDRDQIIDMTVEARHYSVSAVTDCDIDLSKYYCKERAPGNFK